MSIKTTNPALIKKYLSGKLEPGDSSKDFIIEADYALVFQGKIPYQKEPRKRLVMWRDKKGQFYRYMFHLTPKLNELLISLTPITVQGIACQDPTVYAYNGICGLVESCNQELQEDADRFITKINLAYEGANMEKVWEFFKDKEEHLKPLWNSKLDIQELPSDILVEIMTRKMLAD